MLIKFCLSLSIIKVTDGKAVKVTFKKFFLSEPGQENSKDCQKDYVKVNGKKWVPAHLSKKKPQNITTEQTW